jgi:23S rRNA pseudouridine1911/1915/1917 synthase
MWRELRIDRGDAGVRVDRVLLRHLADVQGISRTRIQAWIAGGSVLVNDRPLSRSASRLALGDRVKVQVPDARRRGRPQPEDLPLDVLYEDDDLIAVDKPAGIVVHPSYRNTSGTLLNALLWHMRSAAPSDAPKIVQRLDKNTSGVLLVAKRRSVHAALQRAMYRNEVAKDYLAIVVGRPTPARGTIDLALDRDPWDRRRVVVRDRGGQPSVTKYERLASSRETGLSLVRCRLVTGRMHQIRVHLSTRGWPLVGDPTYGPSKLPEVADPDAQRAIAGFTRQALHAWKVALNHPTTGVSLEITAPLPDDMKTLVSRAGLKAGPYTDFLSS